MKEKEINSGYPGATFIYTKNGKMSYVFDLIEKYAPLENPILITGETGTGKEQIVKIIHAISRRPGKLISINLSAIPNELIENELFGHIKGAFTGADETTSGLIEKAEFGTLHIDEIGEVPLQHQVKLLRLIQEKEFEKIGSHKTIKSTCRFIFSTNRDLEDAVNKKLFRSDLYYRISTFHIHIPSLRERKEDIPKLIDHFLWVIENQFKKKIKIHHEALNLLIKYDWPGNVRELENVLYRIAATLENSNEITIRDLPEFINKGNIDMKINDFFKKKQELEEMERNLIFEVVDLYKGNLYKASRKLKISRGALQYKLKKLKNLYENTSTNQ